MWSVQMPDEAPIYGVCASPSLQRYEHGVRRLQGTFQKYIQNRLSYKASLSFFDREATTRSYDCLTSSLIIRSGTSLLKCTLIQCFLFMW